jgi:hypothetical protein
LAWGKNIGRQSRHSHAGAWEREQHNRNLSVKICLPFDNIQTMVFILKLTTCPDKNLGFYLWANYS